VGGADPRPVAETHADPRFFWLTVFQYVLIAVVTITFVAAIVFKLDKVESLAQLDTARGLITFLITLGTVAIAIMLALTAILTRDFDKRIVVGKEILTVLVAVLGTIVGFYYGATTTKVSGATGGASNTATVTVETPKLTRGTDGALTLTANITGGTKPYQFSVKFSPDTIGPVENKQTDGQITAPVALPNPAPKEISVMIEGKDANGTPLGFNKDGKIKTTVPGP
jgi:hypothetical protein